MEPTVPPVPSDLLAPLLGVAADVLVDLEEAPTGLAADDGFADELVLGASDDALRRAIDQDPSFRRAVSTRFMDDPRAIDALDGWSVEDALDRVRGAASDGTLPVLVSALYAARPTGWGYGLGAACALDLGSAPSVAPSVAPFAAQVSDDERADEVRAALEMAEQAEEGARRARDELAAMGTRLERADDDVRRVRAEAEAARARAEQAEEAARRAQGACEDAERRFQSAEHRLREERAEADARMAGPRHELEQARSRITELAAELASYERRLVQADADRAIAVDRARAAELEIEETKRGRLPAHERIALADAASLARRLSARLDELTPPEVAPTRAAPVVADPAVRAPEPASRTAPPGPRPAPRIPVGMRADTVEGIDAILRTPRLVVVVDASPAARAAWPSERAGEQRKHLVAALRALHSRYRCDLVAVFLGDDLEPPAKLGKPGVKAVLTEPGEAVEALILREVAAVPASVPVLVISSDGHVPAEVGRLGATTVAVEPFLAALTA
ncbi:MAG: hypothetical protein ACKOZL_06665 [Actinomycetes bacterium]